MTEIYQVVQPLLSFNRVNDIAASITILNPHELRVLRIKSDCVIFEEVLAGYITVARSNICRPVTNLYTCLEDTHILFIPGEYVIKAGPAGAKVFRLYSPMCWGGTVSEFVLENHYY